MQTPEQLSRSRAIEFPEVTDGNRYLARLGSCWSMLPGRVGSGQTIRSWFSDHRAAYCVRRSMMSELMADPDLAGRVLILSADVIDNHSFNAPPADSGSYNINKNIFQLKPYIAADRGGRL